MSESNPEIRDECPAKELNKMMGVSCTDENLCVECSMQKDIDENVEMYNALAGDEAIDENVERSE